MVAMEIYVVNKRSLIANAMHDFAVFILPESGWNLKNLQERSFHKYGHVEQPTHLYLGQCFDLVHFSQF